MITTTILAIIILLTAFIAFKYDKWGYMLVSTITTAVVMFIGVEQLDNVILSTIHYLQEYLNTIAIIVFLLTLTSTAALWQRNRDSKIKEQEEKKKRTDYINQIQLAGFVEGQIENPKTGWDVYIINLCERLSKTKLHKESFALGIAGDWGSGKTTFLSQLRPELKKTFQVIDFNPWACTDANIVIADFFKTLKAKMPKRDKELLNDIRQYVTLLTETEIVSKNFITIADNFLETPDNSITSLKSEIETKLTEADIRYAVIIDDLDRLQHDELFEILRLIRITASFSNILFIVTYDRHHIEDMLHTDGIFNGSQYVKKIFTTEVVLPGMEPYTLPKLLMDEIERLLGKDSQIPVAISNTVYSKNQYDTYELLTYLQNFRDVKRFSMAFATDVSTVEKYTPGEFSFVDFFWLEILRYIDYDTYSNLRVNPSAYVNISSSILTIKDSLEMKTVTHNILKKLFTTSTGRAGNSIVFMHNFHNYFSFRIQDNKLSHAEFSELLKISDIRIIESKIQTIYTQSKIESLLDHFRCSSIQQLPTEDVQKNYLMLMFTFMPYTNKHFIATVKGKLSIGNFVTINKEELYKHAKTLIHDLVQKGNVKRGYINMLLTQLHSKYYFDSTQEEPDHYEYQSIIDDDTLVQESVNNLRAILGKLTTPVDIVNATAARGKLRLFLQNATIDYSTDITYDPVTTHYKCLPYKAFLDYFSQHQSDKLDEFMEPFEFDDDERALAEDQEYFESRLTQIEKVFGSLQNFKEITYQCFTNPVEEKDRWIKTYWKIK